jgi:hypothetical protein
MANTGAAIMTQQTNPNPGTHGDVLGVVNHNATDAETRIDALEEASSEFKDLIQWTPELQASPLLTLEDVDNAAISSVGPDALVSQVELESAFVASTHNDEPWALEDTVETGIYISPQTSLGSGAGYVYLFFTDGSPSGGDTTVMIGGLVQQHFPNIWSITLGDFAGGGGNNQASIDLFDSDIVGGNICLTATRDATAGNITLKFYINGTSSSAPVFTHTFTEAQSGTPLDNIDQVVIYAFGEGLATTTSIVNYGQPPVEYDGVSIVSSGDFLESHPTGFDRAGRARVIVGLTDGEHYPSPWGPKGNGSIVSWNDAGDPSIPYTPPVNEFSPDYYDARILDQTVADVAVNAKAGGVYLEKQTGNTLPLQDFYLDTNFAIPDGTTVTYYNFTRADLWEEDSGYEISSWQYDIYMDGSQDAEASNPHPKPRTKIVFVFYEGRWNGTTTLLDHMPVLSRDDTSVLPGSTTYATNEAADITLTLVTAHLYSVFDVTTIHTGPKYGASIQIDSSTEIELRGALTGTFGNPGPALVIPPNSKASFYKKGFGVGTVILYCDLVVYDNGLEPFTESQVSGRQINSDDRNKTLVFRGSSLKTVFVTPQVPGFKFRIFQRETGAVVLNAANGATIAIPGAGLETRSSGVGAVVDVVTENGTDFYFRGDIST